MRLCMFCNELFPVENGCAHDTMSNHPDNLSYPLYKWIELIKLTRKGYHEH